MGLGWREGRVARDLNYENRLAVSPADLCEGILRRKSSRLKPKLP